MKMRNFLRQAAHDLVKQNYSKYVSDSPNFNFAVGGNDEAIIASAQMRILREAGLQSLENILEIGSGTGRVLIELGKYLGPESTYIGVDVVDKCVQLTNDRINHLQLSKNSFQGMEMRDYLDFPAKEFSFVFAFSVFTHMEAEEIYNTLVKLKEVTNLNSKLLFTFLPLEHEFGKKLFEQESKISLSNRYGRVRNVAISYKDAEILALRAGYKIVNSNWSELENPYDGQILKTNQSWLVLQQNS
jgi:cyclopropane fatty-acyl-phospholipid synthase-like methyltransferase